MNNAIRWQQRFDNFERAYLNLNQVIATKNIMQLSDLEKAGVIQYFEILIELSWKVLKDYLANQGYDNINNFKKAIRQAFQNGIISDATTWMNALQQLDLTLHCHHEAVLSKILNFIIENFYPIVRDLYFQLKDKH